MFDEIQSWAAMKALADSKRAYAEARARLEKHRDKEDELLKQLQADAKEMNEALAVIEDMCGGR